MVFERKEPKQGEPWRPYDLQCQCDGRVSDAQILRTIDHEVLSILRPVLNAIRDVDPMGDTDEWRPIVNAIKKSVSIREHRANLSDGALMSSWERGLWSE